MTYLAGEMLSCLLGALILGGLLGWLWTRMTAGRRLRQLAASHEHTLSITEGELQRLTGELAAKNKIAKEAAEALPALEARVAESEGAVIAALLGKDAAEAKLREHVTAIAHLRDTLEKREREVAQLEMNINKLNPLVTEINGLRSQAAAWERKSRQQEEQSAAHWAQRDQEIALLRGRVNELEPLPAKLVEREARVRELDLKLRATEAAAQARVQTLETSLREAEARARQAETSLSAAERRTAAVLDERSGEIQALRQRLNELEAMSAKWLETDQALLTARADLAQKEAELRETLVPRAMAAVAGAGGASLALGSSVALPPSHPAPAAEPAPLTPGELQGCLQSLLFDRRIQFLPKNAELVPESHETLAEVAALMAQAPGVPVIIEGHTDNWGDPHTNWSLSVQRAEAVRAELTALGVEERRLSCVGYGEARPIDDNSTPDGRWRNRRIEIRVSPAEGAR